MITGIKNRYNSISWQGRILLSSWQLLFVYLIILCRCVVKSTEWFTPNEWTSSDLLCPWYDSGPKFSKSGKENNAADLLLKSAMHVETQLWHCFVSCTASFDWWPLVFVIHQLHKNVYLHFLMSILLPKSCFTSIICLLRRESVFVVSFPEAFFLT